MNMNLRRDDIVNRVNEFVGEGKDFVRKVADDVGSNARDVAWKAKKEFVRGRRAIISAEQSVTRHAKDHPMAYMLIGFSIASLVAATLILSNRRQDRD